MTIKLVSLNMELDHHLIEQRRFFDREAPDIACLQECHEDEFEALRAEWGHGVFAPMCRTRRLDGRFARQGVCMVARRPLDHMRARAYHDPGIPLVDYEMDRTPQHLLRRILLTASITVENDRTLTIGTTHFTWSANGQATPAQHHDVGRMLEYLGEHDPVVFCGDFNAPRGGEIFARIAAHYTDHVPADCTSSIDGARHRAGPLDLMIDGLFSSPGIFARGVRLVDGVSDHKAIVAEIAMDQRRRRA